MAAASPVSRFLPSQDLFLAGMVLWLHRHLASMWFRRGNTTTSHLRRVAWGRRLRKEVYSFLCKVAYGRLS